MSTDSPQSAASSFLVIGERTNITGSPKFSKAIKAGDWDHSVKLLQTILEAREDSFYRQPHTDRTGKPAERWASSRAEAERLLATLPDDGRKVYEVSFNETARNTPGWGL